MITIPITPYHLGPGMLLKGASPEKVSPSSFVAVNLVIDSEVAWNLAVGSRPLHGTMHTFVGSVVTGIIVGGFVGLFGKINGLDQQNEFSSIPCVIGGLAGGLLQSGLDVFVHDDVQVFWPLAPQNPFTGIISLYQLEVACVVSGLIGLILFGLKLRGV